MRHGRLPWLGPGQLDARQREFYDSVAASPRASSKITPLFDAEGRFNGPFNAMLPVPELGIAVNRVGTALRFPGTLPRLVFESIVLISARERHAGYEWYAHAPLAEAAGLRPDQIQAVLQGDYAALSTSVAPALIELVLASLHHEQPSENLVRDVVKAYGTSGVTEAVMTVGHYDLISALMSTWDSPMPDGVPDPLN